MMAFNSFRGNGKTIEEAMEQAFSEAFLKYPSACKDDFDLTVLQKPVNNLLIRKEAIVEAKLTDEAIERLSQELEKKQIEANRKRDEEKLKKKIEYEKVKKAREEEAKKQFEIKLTGFREELINANNTFLPLMGTLASALFIDACMLIEAGLDFELDNTANDMLLVWEAFMDYKDVSEISKEDLLDLFKQLVRKYEKKDLPQDSHTTVGSFYNSECYLNCVYKEYMNRSSVLYVPIFMQRVEDYDDNIQANINVGKAAEYDRDYRFNLARHDIYLKYIRNLYLIPVLLLDLKNASIILNNCELMTIVQNATDGSVWSSPNEELYEIYDQYYSDIFETKLDEGTFRNAYNLATLMTVFADSRKRAMDNLSSVGINTDELIDEFKSKNKSERGYFFDYLISEKLEKGFFDSIVQSDKYDALIYSLINILTTDLLKKCSLLEYIPEIYHVKDFRDKIDVYTRKYNLLHPNKDKKDSVKNIREQLESAQTGVDFENVLALIYKQMGYEVETTKTSGDQGADLIIKKESVKGVIQAKFYSSSVGNSAVQEVVAAMKYYGATKGIVITNSEFTSSAKELAYANDIQLIDGQGLEYLINSLI